MGVYTSLCYCISHFTLMICLPTCFSEKTAFSKGRNYATSIFRSQCGA